MKTIGAVLVEILLEHPLFVGLVAFMVSLWFIADGIEHAAGLR